MRSNMARQRKAANTPAASPNGDVLERLGIFGYRRVEPVVIAALATEEPLLLVGAHGTAKSLLLNRLAGALGLEHRHYNASLLNFDDLVGYPFPDAERTELRYVRTPGSVWGAQSVFLDEISRCRPDLQNKLFPIIHERRVQGLDLPDLRYRWAAMNPPSLDDDDDDEGYRGSEPLDAALADRFPFVVQVPGLADLGENERRAVVAGRSPDAGAADALRTRVLAATTALPGTRAALSARIVEWVCALTPLLAKLELPVSPRRTRMLHDAALAVHAACGQGAEARDSAFLALVSGLPQRAFARVPDPTKLLAAHRQAWSVSGALDDPRKALLAEQDRVRRIALAAKAKLPAVELSTFVLDALAGLPRPERVALAAALFPVARESWDLTAVAFEALANEFKPLEVETVRHLESAAASATFSRQRAVITLLGRLDPADGVARNLLLFLSVERDPFDPDAVLARLREWRQLFGGADA